MTKNDALILYSLIQSLRYEIRATDTTYTQNQRDHWRKSADNFADIILQKTKNAR